MDLYTLQGIVGAVGTVLSVLAPVAGAVYTWIATRNAAARKEIADLTKLVAELGKRLDGNDLQLQAAAHTAEALAATATSLAEHDKRIQAVEGELKHLPDKDMVNELKLAISDLNGTVKAMDAQLNGLTRTVNNIDGYLREDSK